MATVTIGFSKSSSKFAPFSWIIKLVQGTPYSHAYLKIHRDDINRDVYYQASHDLVNFMSSTQFNNEETIIKEIDFEFTDSDKIKLSQFMYDQLGKPYAVSEILGLLCVVLCAKIGIKIQNPVQDGTSQFYCSELVSYFLSQCDGITLPKDLADMTPKDLYEFVQTLPKSLKLKT